MSRAKLALPVMVMVMALAAAAGAAPRPPFTAGKTYLGVTSQSNACQVGARITSPCRMTMRPGAGGLRLVLTLRVSEPCGNGETFRYDFVTRFPARRGTVKKDGSYSLVSDVSSDFGNGTTAESRVLFDGRFIRRPDGRTLSTGAFRATSRVFFADGSETVCRSGRVTYTLRP